MLKRLIKQAIFLSLFALCFYLKDRNSSLFFHFGSKGFYCSIWDLSLYIFLFYTFLEALYFVFCFSINLIKKDVLISNHAFLSDKESINIIENNTKDKIVLSRHQFDESAILIVKAMSAITSGLMSNARRHLVNLRKIIGNDAIIDILMLKIYKGEKNFDKMEQLSQKLMQNEDIQLVGMKAALEAQIEKKEFTEALKTANQAFEVRQDLYWVVSSAFLLRAQNNDWLGALEVLESGIDKKITPEAKASRLKAIALYQLAKEAFNANDKTKFFKFITQALDENNKLIPAALDLADFYVKNDKQLRKAEKVLCNIWTKNPTYEIAMAYLGLFNKDNKMEKIQRMEKLALLNNIRPSLNNLILAELYVKAKKFAKARTECKIFLLKNPATEKLAEIMSCLNKKSIQTNKTEYAKDFQWVCANCGKVHTNWEAICENCGEIGRIYWHLYLDNSINYDEE